MKKINRVKYLYAFYDVEMDMWTEPVLLRNDIEAKKLFNALLQKNQFNGCSVSMFCVGKFTIDGCGSRISPILDSSESFHEIYLADTVEDGDVVNE